MMLAQDGARLRRAQYAPLSLLVHTPNPHPDNLVSSYAYKVGLRGLVLSKDGLGATGLQGRAAQRDSEVGVGCPRLLIRAV